MTVFVFRRTHLQLERVAHHPFVPTLVEVHPLDLDKHPRNVARVLFFRLLRRQPLGNMVGSKAEALARSRRLSLRVRAGSLLIVQEMAKATRIEPVQCVGASSSTTSWLKSRNDRP